MRVGVATESCTYDTIRKEVYYIPYSQGLLFLVERNLIPYKVRDVGVLQALLRCMGGVTSRNRQLYNAQFTPRDLGPVSYTHLTLPTNREV